MTRKRLTPYLISCAVAASFAAAIAQSGSPGHPTPEEGISTLSESELAADSLRRADSIANARALQLVTKASDSYKELKFVQYDGVSEPELYPMVRGVHRNVMEALADSRVGDSDRTKLRSILLDLDPLLMNGAIFYSGRHDTANMNDFAKACVDTRMRPDMRSMPFGKSGDQLYPSMVYCAASSTYNSGDYPKSIDYFIEYLSTPAQEQRQTVARFLGQACINSKTPERGVDLLLDATQAFPTDYNLLMITLQNCLDSGETEKMGSLMERALLMRPDDEQLLNVQAALMENDGNYAGALDMYGRLYELHPENLEINQHLALCYYNLGVENFNKSLTADNDKDSKRHMRQAKAYLGSASSKLSAVVDAEPSNVKYLKALAMTCASLGETGRLTELNNRLTALGQNTVTGAAMPEAIAYDDHASGRKSGDAPDFQDYARSYVEHRMADWTRRGEFEKKEDFEKRVSQNNVYAEYQRLCMDAEKEYLKKYASKLRISDISLQPYDIDNESYLVSTEYGQIVVKVPLKNKEAETFRAQWAGIQTRNLKFYIRDNRPAIASVDLVTPQGKTYSYVADNAAEYDFTEVQLDVNSFIAQGTSARQRSSQSDLANRGYKPASVIRAKSDVDENIPLTSRRASNTVALVWANENYKNVTPVVSALNDGETFAEYCTRTLGIPSEQVIIMKDATYAEMLSSMAKLRQLVNALGNGTDIVFYYAGHGIPDEATKDAFLLPVDGDGVLTAATYPLKKLYSDLADTRAGDVMVFLDACFSGATRDGGMIAEARGVALKPKATAPEGSMYVLSAASDQETALPYTEKNHGMFTYFLLKKLQETKGNVTLQQLADYVQTNVKKHSLTVNRKVQTPSVKVSGKLAGDWTTKKLKP